MNSLARLSIYNDSDSEEESLDSRLPLPGFLENSNKTKVPQVEVNKDGKVRNFPHEPGNWATYLFIPVESSELLEYANNLLHVLKPLDLKLVDDFHISLTKTVILRHHWIPDFISNIKNGLADLDSFRIRLFGLKVYCNEHKTRTFLSLKVNEGEDSMKLIIDELIKCFNDYNLDGFYEDPSFHMSLLWCPGDKVSEINKLIKLIPSKLKEFEIFLKVCYCSCATGNKRFHFNF